MEEKYITIEEASELLSVNKRQVTQMINKGLLRAKDVNASGKKRHIWRVWYPDVIANNETN